VAVIAVASAKGSPGTTITSLAFTLSWPRRLILAECDPAGGDIAAGYLRHLELDGSRGLMQLLVAGLRGQAINDVWQQLVDLTPPEQSRLLLPGITNPGQAVSLAPSWTGLWSFFASLEYADPPFDVIVDCGRLIAPHAPWPLLGRTDLVLLVVRPTLSSLLPAHTVLASLDASAIRDHVGLVVVGDGQYDDRTVAQKIGVPVLAHLPRDDRSAHALAHGGTVLTRRPLLRAAAAAEPPITTTISRYRERLHGSSPREEARRVNL